MKTNVVHLVEKLGIGGLERVLTTIALNLNKEKYHVSVWCLSKGGFFADKLIEEGVDVKILNISTSRNPVGIYKLYKLLKYHRIDLIHTHAYSAGTIGRISAFLAGVSVIISHNHSVHDYYNKYYHFVEWLLSLITDRIICVSDTVKRFTSETQGISAKRLVTIHNGINDVCSVSGKAIVDLKEELGILPEYTVIGTVTHMEEHKGILYLIQAASHLLRSRKDLIFLLVGDGAQEEELKKLCVNLKIEKNVIFTGERSDIPEMLSLIDIFVLPSVREGLGLSILEAMACGKPVIATNVGGIPEVVEDGVSGILVPPKEPDTLHGAIVELLDDKGKRDVMGLNGKRICDESFNVRTMVDKIEELYDLFIRGSDKKA
ncbi:MAG: glycosyltransferase [Candidatus Scalindua sp.]|jgi:glycosyltransferase involved in cell wall biosynthesis|nr:glycosyltransferase [Candidatus Scalindua sp.]MBT5304288.1 glycosyltransferase [Candidatus Scalindua sp.]MBT6052025.1 glycosyltransferase [Candidatus Scalindua sp.]MBT6228991.1 glycosyltransferase [Candidatus Scalindua sp.]MBT6561200.1 glycosyltransferase [Candidatus Scalindua sp.]